MHHSRGLFVGVFAGLFAVAAFFAFAPPRQTSAPRLVASSSQTTLTPAAGICLLTPPANPLSAKGLATPWQLSGTTGGTNCTEENANTQAFVEATVLDPATGHLSAYDPLVVDKGDKPAVAPVVPSLPNNAVVGIWVGSNTNVDLPAGVQGCTDGVDSVFSQQAYCNAPQFFQAVNAAVGQKRLAVPPIGTASDGQPCPTSRSFSVVDQDQSDNTQAHYLVAHNHVAQDTTANRAKLNRAQTAFNGSDEGVVVPPMDAALGCKVWKVPDLADGQQTIGTGSLNEIQAAAFQGQPIATVPAADDFVLNPAPNGAQDLNKLNLYRQQVDQQPVQSLTQSSPGPVSANTTTYCQNLLQVGLPRIAHDQAALQNQPSPFPAMANNLYTFLANRFMATFQDQPGFLHCTALLHVQNPVTVQTNGNGVVVSATINLKPAPLQTSGNNAGTQQPSPAPVRMHG